MCGILRVGAGTWSATTEHLLGSRDERMAYLLARAAVWSDVDGETTLDLLVVSALPVPDEALVAQSRVQVEVDPEFTRAVLISCYEAGLSLVDVHTHPFAGDRVSFSAQDEHNMRETHAEFLRSMPDSPPVGVASLVLGRTGVAGCFTDPRTGSLRRLDRFTVVGDHCTEVALCA